MLETLRSFGRDRLREAGEEPEAASALARHALAIGEEAGAAMEFSGGELAALRWLDSGGPLLRQAQEWLEAPRQGSRHCGSRSRSRAGGWCGAVRRRHTRG